MVRLEQLLTWYASLRGSSEPTELPARLAEAFGAEGAGLAGPFRGRHAPSFSWWKSQPDAGFPWQEKMSPLPVIRQVVRHENLTWLLAPLGLPLEDVVAWVALATPPAGGDADLDPLAAAGLLLWQALERSCPGHPWLLGHRQKQSDDRNEHAARFAGKLAHDFGNLLTSVLGFSELARAQVPSGSSADQFVSEILAAARLGASWVHKLQIFSRRIQPEIQSCDFLEVAHREEQRLRTLWQAKALLQLQIPEDLPRLAMSPFAAQSVLAPVLDNAFEALDSSHSVRLVARQTRLADNDAARIVGQPRSGLYIEVVVTNTGEPLPRALLEGRLDTCYIESRKRQRGLGLPVSYAILVNHGGGISFQNDAPRTATVRLLLPVHTPGAPASQPDSAPAVVGAARPSTLSKLSGDRLIVR